MSLYILPFLWGLAGGFSHCIGMCGIFVLSCSGAGNAGSAPRRSPHALERHLAFQAGRMITLSLLGAIAGAIGSLAGFASHFARVQGIVSVAAGVLMIALALGYLGLIPQIRIPEVDVMGAGGGRGRRLYIRALQSRSPAKPFLLGLLVGLLPCMLTYTVLIPAAASLSWAKGLFIMLSFGTGTIPGLLALGLVSSLFAGVLRNPRFRVGMTRVSGVVMLIMAALFISRGIPRL